MRRHLVRTTLAAAVAAAAAAHPAAAQLRLPPVQLIVGMGPSQSATLGFIRDANGQTVPARHLNSNSLMVGLQTRTPVRGIDLRLSLQSTQPTLVLGDEIMTRTNLTTVSLDAIVNLPRLGGVQPYVLAGGGIKHYGFDQERFQLARSPVIPRDETDLMVHAGLGARYNVGKVDLFLEAAGSSNRFQNNPVTQFSGSAQNYTYTFGVRIPLHR